MFDFQMASKHAQYTTERGTAIFLSILQRRCLSAIDNVTQNTESQHPGISWNLLFHLYENASINNNCLFNFPMLFC